VGHTLYFNDLTLVTYIQQYFPQKTYILEVTRKLENFSNQVNNNRKVLIPREQKHCAGLHSAKSGSTVLCVYFNSKKYKILTVLPAFVSKLEIHLIPSVRCKLEFAPSFHVDQ